MPHDIVDTFSTHLKNVLTRALCLAVEQEQTIVRPEHLLWAMGTQKGCIGAEVLKKCGVKAADLKKLVGERFAVSSTSETMSLTLKLSDDAKRVVEKAVLTASLHGHRYVGTEHLLCGILQINPVATQAFFRTIQADLKELNSQLTLVLKSTSKFPELTGNMGADLTPVQTHIPPLASGGNTQTTQPQTAVQEEKRVSALEFFSVELTSLDVQKRIDPVIGREDEIERIMEILCRRTKNNPLLVGEAGVGKTAIVEGLAKRIVEGRVPPALAHKRIFALDMALLIAGTMYRGEFEGRVRQIVEEVKSNPDLFLFIDEIHAIVGAGAASGSMDAANILKPALARGEIRCIGSTTPAEYKRNVESDAALERRFQTVLVEEPTPEQTLEILEGIAPAFEAFHRVRITHEALSQAVALSSRYLPDRRLPDKAIDLMDEASAAARVHDPNPGPLQKERELRETLAVVQARKRLAVVEERFDEAAQLKDEEQRLAALSQALNSEGQASPVPVITHTNIARVVSRASGVPLEDLIASDKSALLKLETRLRERVLGQDAVIDTVAGALRAAKTGVAHPSRPLASFLFLGPSGVGKTELAKAIAQLFFHSKQHLIRLDMSEYSEGFTMSKLIGSPPGYVGYKDTANLTDRVKQRPYSVVLFDEIEKAHRDVQNLLLQILEEGELTDATGRRVNFKNTIVILTSNVGLERFERGDMGFAGTQADRTLLMHQDLRTELEERFRPELLNRIDHTCLFQPLADTVLESIVEKQLAELVDRLKLQGLTLDVHESLIPHICSKVESKLGARNVRTLIAREIEHKIASRLSAKDRPAKLRVALKGDEVLVTKAR